MGWYILMHYSFRWKLNHRCPKNQNMGHYDLNEIINYKVFLLSPHCIVSKTSVLLLVKQQQSHNDLHYVHSLKFPAFYTNLFISIETTTLIIKGFYTSMMDKKNDKNPAELRFLWQSITCEEHSPFLDRQGHHIAQGMFV